MIYQPISDDDKLDADGQIIAVGFYSTAQESTAQDFSELVGPDPDALQAVLKQMAEYSAQLSELQAKYWFLYPQRREVPEFNFDPPIDRSSLLAFRRYSLLPSAVNEEAKRRILYNIVV